MSLPADLTALLDDLRPAAERAVALERRRRRVRLAAAALAAAAIFAGAALAAVRLLGEPAPAYVQAQLVPLSRGLFAGVNRPLPSPATARVVAEATDATLYGLGNVEGDYCTEAVGVARGLIVDQECAWRRGVRLDRTSGWRIAAVVDGVTPPVVDYGRAPAGTATLRATLRDGATESVPLGLDGFWLYEPSSGEQTAARQGPVEVEALGADGAVLQRWTFDPPVAVSTEGAPISRIAGRTEIGGARSVQIAADGVLRVVPVAADGSFEWTAPADARIAYATVAVLDAVGVHLAEGTALEDVTIRSFVAQAKGEAAPPAVPANPTEADRRAARTQCVTSWNTSATAAEKAALARRRTGTAWMDAFPSAQPQWLCIFQYPVGRDVVFTGGALGSGVWSKPRPTVLAAPSGVLVTVDAKGRIAILK